MKNILDKPNIIAFISIITGIIMLFIGKVLNMEIIGLFLSYIPAMFSLFIILQFMFNFKAVINFLKPGIVGKDGVLDFSDISIIIFTLLYAFIVITTGLYAASYPEVIVMVTAAGAGVLSAINVTKGIFGKDKTPTKKEKSSDDILNE